MSIRYEVVWCIINEGFSEVAMNAAREAGATGGTVLHATGTANAEAEKLFGITVQPRKEIVLILVDSKIKEAVLHNLYSAVGLGTAGQGIAFTFPVSNVVGIKAFTDSAPANKEESKKETKSDSVLASEPEQKKASVEAVVQDSSEGSDERKDVKIND